MGVEEFIQELVVATTNIRIYWTEHPRVVSSVVNLRRILKELAGDEQAAELVIGAAEDWLFHDCKPLLGASLVAPRLLATLSQLGSGGLSFANWADDGDFLALVDILASRKLEATSFAEANLELEQRGCTSIRFLPLYSEDGRQEIVKKVPRRVPIVLHQRLVDNLQETMVQVSHGNDIAIDETRGLIEKVLGKLKGDPASILRTTRYERYDAFTFGHSIRVAVLALNFASQLTRDVELLQRIGLAALLHDIGKARVPFKILHSTQRLDPEERELMSQHAEFGAEILLEQGGADPLSVCTAFGHHRTMENQGYPRTLHDARLSAGTKIVKLCDVYEALTAVRPYKDQMSPLRAFRVMMSMKGHFDPQLLRKFIRVSGIYPVGSKVLLNTGEEASVIGQTQLFEQPLVELESSGQKRTRRDLSHKDGSHGIRVAELLLDKAG